MLEPRNSCRGDLVPFRFAAGQQRDSVDPNCLSVRTDDQMDFAKLVAPRGLHRHPVVHLPVPVGPQVPQHDLLSFSGVAPLVRNTVGSIQFGAASACRAVQPPASLSRLRARVLARAELLPLLTSRRTLATSPAGNRTMYLSRTTDPLPGLPCCLP